MTGVWHDDSGKSRGRSCYYKKYPSNSPLPYRIQSKGSSMHHLSYVDHESNLIETKNNDNNDDTDQKNQWLKKRRQ